MPSSPHPAATLAAVASAAAGAIHAAAAGSHAELTTLSRLFAVAAVAQIGWAAASLRRPGRPTVLAGVAINLAALGAWGVTRSAGLDAIEGLERSQSVGFADGLAAVLAVVAALGAALSLGATVVPRVARVAVPALVAVIAVATVPAMATPHDHGDHAHDGEVAAGHHDDPGHVHDDSHDHGDDDHHDSDPAAPSADEVATSEELGYPASFASFLDQAPSAEARARAEQLIIDTHEAMRAFPDEAAVQAAGFLSIGDGATGWEHYIHVGRIADQAVLDPDGIESIVLEVHPDGTKEVASAMYLLPFGSTMDDVPDIAGDLTEWHDHQNLCWEGARVVGTTNASGSCLRGEFRGTQPMLHVWVTEHPCGPFAGIEGSHGSGCAHGHDDTSATGDHPHAPGTPPHED
ncbi:MAG TPA: hypothetical protein VFV42_07815 [Acidimicrobiales bacterium]|nr:hypothetical protein [Acidimicrobiales bacterium]